VYIIEDVLNDIQYKELSDIVMGVNFPWHYNPSSYLNEPIESVGRVVDYPQFVHRVFDSGETRSNIFSYVLPIVRRIEHTKLLRVKINLNVQDFEMKDDSYSVPHVDLHEKNCVTAVYYLNDSDGDTYLFNEPFGTPFEELTVKERITPKKNSLVVFPSDTLHSGNTPRKCKRRVVININVITK
jgi:hypothetical protein